MRKISNFFIYLFFAAISFAGLVNCKKDSARIDPVQPPPAKTDSTFNQNVKVIDSTVLKLNTDTLLLNQGIYEYTYTGTTPSFKINDVIIGGSRGGYLRKINAINSLANKISLQTTQGHMDDVFNTTGFKFDINSDNFSRINSGFTFDLSNKELYRDGPLSLTLSSGNLNFDADWNFGFKFDGLKLDTFEMSCKNVNLGGQFNLNVTASQAITLLEHSSSIAKVSKPLVYLIPGTIGIVPVVIPVYVRVDLELIAKFSLGINASISRSIYVNTNNTLDLGIKYKDAQWQSTYNPHTSLNISAGDRTGNAGITVNLALLPQVSVFIYGIAGPYVSVGVKEQLKGNVASPALDWDFTADAWINTVIGAKAEIFSKALFDFNKEFNSDPISYITPFKLNKISGDNQSASAGQDLPNPIVVKVVDSKGAAESNVPVYFYVTGGGGTVNPASILTDASGIAKTTWTTGASGGPQEMAVKALTSNGTLIQDAPAVFTSSPGQGQMIIITSPVSSITANSATGGGNIVVNSGSAITERGVCWSASPGPTTANSKSLAAGTTTGIFSCNLNGLKSGTTYYSKAYAVSGDGTFYGDEQPFTTSPNIGDSTAGGIVFYIDGSGQHGLVCSPQDLGAAAWDFTIFDVNNPGLYNPPVIGTTSTSFGTGFSNTQSITAVIGAGNYAAGLCKSYNGSAFNDWFLPSSAELDLMYQNLKITGLANFSTLNSSFYWSSSEIDSRAVWCEKFSDGSLVNNAWKNNRMNVRAARAF